MTAPRRLRHPRSTACRLRTTYYLDEAATYDANRGNELLLTRAVNASTTDALGAWIDQAWVAGNEVITPGVGPARVGEVHRYVNCGMEETLVSAGVPSATDKPDAVASVVYKISDFGPLPPGHHIALVRSLPVDSKTEIVWTVKLTLPAQGNDALPDPNGIVPVLTGVISGLLEGIEATFK